MVHCGRHNISFSGFFQTSLPVSFPPSSLLLRCLPVSRSFSVSGRPCLYSYPAFPLYTPFLRNKEVVLFLTHGEMPVSCFLLLAHNRWWSCFFSWYSFCLGVLLYISSSSGSPQWGRINSSSKYSPCNVPEDVSVIPKSTESICV